MKLMWTKIRMPALQLHEDMLLEGLRTLQVLDSAASWCGFSTDIWGRYVVARGAAHQIWLIAYTIDLPHDYCAVVFYEQSHQIRYPTSNALDFQAVCEALHLQTIEDHIAIHDCICCEYGALWRNEYPVRVAPTHFDDVDMSNFQPSSSATLWWRRWGGDLFAAEVTDIAAHTLTITPIATGIGPYRRLPDRYSR